MLIMGLMYPKVLVFTASSKRPLFLRNCIFQMQQQTYPITHAIYVNSPNYSSADDSHNYLELMNDIHIKKGNKVNAGYGPSASHHRNHMAAINLTEWQEYDLFFKVDDDDIYRTSYIEAAVQHYIDQKWDFSGEISKGHIHHEHWHKHHSFQEFSSSDLPDNAMFMPPTFAWNKSCMKIIMDIDDITGSEDKVWRETLAHNKSITTKVRPPGNFIYNIHSGNTSGPVTGP